MHQSKKKFAKSIQLSLEEKLKKVQKEKNKFDGFFRGIKLTELSGHEGKRIVFSLPPIATLKEAGVEWLFEILELDIFKREKTPEEAIYKAGDELAKELLHLVHAYADELTKEQLERKVLLLRYVDLLASEIGLDFPKERWIVGRLEEAHFIPAQDNFEPLPVPATLLRSSEPDKLWFAKIKTLRDGRPIGEILELKLSKS